MEETETIRKKVVERGAGLGNQMTTNLMDLVGSVRDEVDRTYHDEEGLVTLIVYHLLGGHGYPGREDSVQVLQERPTSSPAQG